MDVVKELVDDFLRFDNEPSNDYKEFLDELRSQTIELNVDEDKIRFIQLVREGLETLLTKHEEKCPHGGNCAFSKNYHKAFYFIDQELSELGIRLNDDHFTFDEQFERDQKIDTILEEIEKLRKGQEIIYDDLYEEIKELKSMYFLKKKNWSQLFLGKLTDLTINGLNQELANRILKSLNESKLLE